jgi:hypothetical protein
MTNTRIVPSGQPRSRGGAGQDAAEESRPSAKAAIAQPNRREVSIDEIGHVVSELMGEMQSLRAALAHEKSRAEKGPAPATRALFEAMAAYIDDGQYVPSNMPPRTLAHAVSKFARQAGLEHAELLKPAGGAAHTLMNDALRGIRKAREHKQKAGKRPSR